MVREEPLEEENADPIPPPQPAWRVVREDDELDPRIEADMALEPMEEVEEVCINFIVSSKGIEANPDKIRALIDMPSPWRHKDVQSLIGRIAALSCFVSKSTDKCIPFFNVLLRNQRFEWTTECEEAFRKLKEHLAQAPILSKPVDGEPLYLYLAVSEHAISAALVREEGKV
ncbi:uncharacterized mitochondrial protein AtMg00860-like [Humulus lupulus]|uniref:uncharacterized mitochondrial protein AtMg00860-like n=1 Tax=Humulus lupulus TaxID=3486 RepID=UPI002B412F21|nr:uncharacterized mitochondrial protein AtMg00860-like [Humulus lupulus]